MASARTTHTLLVVDDDRVGSQRVAELLGERGHRVLLARSWTDALRELSQTAVDLVLMDAVMPNVDGFKLTRLLRERAGSYVPIVFITGTSDGEARGRAFEAGADDLIGKPVDPIELNLRVAAMLRIGDLTRALEEKSRALEEVARRDVLTGLLNRRALEERLPIEVMRARRYGRELGVLMLDVDHFKRINDGFGHEVGDRVLSCLGRTLQVSVRVSDGAYRYGGEELTVIAPETNLTGGVQLAQRIRDAFAAASEPASAAGRQTLSVGVASLAQLEKGATASALVAAADEALYAAKRGGRDRAEAYAPRPTPAD